MPCVSPRGSRTPPKCLAISLALAPSILLPPSMARTPRLWPTPSPLEAPGPENPFSRRRSEWLLGWGVFAARCHWDLRPKCLAGRILLWFRLARNCGNVNAGGGVSLGMCGDSWGVSVRENGRAFCVAGVGCRVGTAAAGSKSLALTGAFEERTPRSNLAPGGGENFHIRPFGTMIDRSRQTGGYHFFGV